MEELVDDKTYINEEAMQLMKFHGSYMQDQREKRAFGQGKFYQFMMRTRQPGGLVTNRLYLVMDDLADKVRGWLVGAEGPRFAQQEPAAAAGVCSSGVAHLVAGVAALSLAFPLEQPQHGGFVVASSQEPHTGMECRS